MEGAASIILLYQNFHDFSSKMSPSQRIINSLSIPNYTGRFAFKSF